MSTGPGAGVAQRRIARHRRSGGPSAVDHQPRGVRAPPCRGSGDPVPESRQLPRFGLLDVDRAAQHQLRRQGRVHGLVEDQVLVPRDGNDPDRPFRRRQEPGRPRGRRGRVAARRAVRDLSGGHAQPRRLPVPGTHRRRPVGDEARLPDLPGRHRRHRSDPTAGRQVAQAVPRVHDQDRASDHTGSLSRPAVAAWCTAR